MQLTTITDETRLVIANLADRATGMVTPSVRLGVTGLSRAGKTVFIAALVHNLIHGGRLPLFKAYAAGRLTGARLEPQPDDHVPRFDYERHVRSLVEERIWPDSTRQISELRLTVNFESASFLMRTVGSGRLHIDIVDYPGEWLLDLPLLSKSYADWSREAIAAASLDGHRDHAGAWLKRLAAVDPQAPADELLARELADVFTDYLRRCRADDRLLSTQPPGRFLMPGDLDNSPALTFAPLRLDDGQAQPDTLAGMMERRYNSYRSVVVRPFYRDHFARLDRQIVLVDALTALNAGPAAVADLETALAAILGSFRLGRTNWLTGLVIATHRPHPVRRHQGRPAPSRRPRPAGSDPRPHGGARQRTRPLRRRPGRGAGAGLGARHARSDGDEERPVPADHHRHAHGRRDGGRQDLRRQDGNRVVSR